MKIEKMKLFVAVFIFGAFITSCSEDQEITPVITVSDFSTTVDENLDKDTSLGTITASLNTNKSLSFSITSQTPADALIIDTETGELKVNDATAFDYEVNTEIIAEVTTAIGDVSESSDVSILLNNVKTEAVNIPDANFKKILVDNSNINTNSDTEISELEAESYTGIINAAGNDVVSVEGIEFFTEITRLALYDNEIESIDLSNNTKIYQLLLSINKITSIDVSKLTLLTDFKCHSNKLTQANVANGNNTNMWRMELQGNDDLTCITVDNVDVPESGWNKGTATYSTDCSK